MKKLRHKNLSCTLQSVLTVFEIHKILFVWSKDSLGGVKEVCSGI